MTPQLDDLFQRHYTRARICRHADRPPMRYIDDLQWRLRDDKLDIRKLKINNKPYWCVVRWVHPVMALGKCAKGITGLDYIPVIVKQVMRDDGLPREVVDNDIRSFVTITKEHARLQWEEAERQWAKDEKEVNDLENDYRTEVCGHHSGKVYMGIANENARRIESGEVQGYGTSGPAKVE